MLKSTLSEADVMLTQHRLMLFPVMSLPYTNIIPNCAYDGQEHLSGFTQAVKIKLK